MTDNRQLAAIARAVGSGERLTRQLLAFARRQPLQPEVISVQERLPALRRVDRADARATHRIVEWRVDEKTKAVLRRPGRARGSAVVDLAARCKGRRCRREGD